LSHLFSIERCERLPMLLFEITVLEQAMKVDTGSRRMSSLGLVADTDCAPQNIFAGGSGKKRGPNFRTVVFGSAAFARNEDDELWHQRFWEWAGVG
jgi:hypothetical protein